MLEGSAHVRLHQPGGVVGAALLNGVGDGAVLAHVEGLPLGRRDAAGG